MHYLVTGASGFIGKNLVDYLLKKQHRVTAIIHNSSIKHEFSTDLYKEIAIVDSLDSLDISSDVDCIFHLAATGVSPRLASWDHLLDINVRLTLSICQLANKLGCRVICSGTFAEYGLSANNYSHIPPGAPLQPTFPYAASKAAASTLAISYALSEGIELAYLRIFNAFGLGQHESNLWPSLRLAAISGCDFPLSPGLQIRDFIPISSVVRQMYFISLLSTNNFVQPMVVNIASGCSTSVLDFCKYWWSYFEAKGSLLPNHFQYRSNEVMRFVPEIHDLLKPFTSIDYN